MRNEEVRAALERKGLKHWRLGEIMGLSEATIYRKLRAELSPKEKEKFLKVIESYERNEE